MSEKMLEAINSSNSPTSRKRSLSTKTSPFRSIFDQSFAKLLQFQLNFAFNESSTTAEDNASDSAEIPNEYRNLLLSLSENRCDHILWIRSLRKLNWLGNGDFSFALDKCGVPTLKNGEYKLNLCAECLDAQMVDVDTDSETNDEMAFHWEGNLANNEKDDQYELQNHAEFPMRSIWQLVKKCAKMMRQHGQITKGSVILVFMPCILQLFVTIFAATRIGAVLVYVNAAINQDPNDLAEILILSGAQLILTVDGFYMDGKLQNTKQTLDLAIKLLEEKQSIQNILKVIIVRHLPNSGRSLSINSKKCLENGGNEFKIEMVPNRDYFWSNLMVEMAADDVLPWEENENDGIEWMDSEDIIFQAISKIQKGEWHFESYTVGQIALLVELLAKKFTKPFNDDEWAQIIAARQKELLKKRQSLAESKSFDERDEYSMDEDEDDAIALARKGSTRSQPGFINTKKISDGSGRGGISLRKKSQQKLEPQIIWPMVETNDVLFLASLFAAIKAKASIFLSETPPSSADPLKIFRQMEAQKISQLLISKSNLDLLSKTMDSAKIWSGEEEEFVRFKLPNLRAIYSVVKGTLANREELKAEIEAILNHYIEKMEMTGGDEPTMNIFHLFC